MTQLLQWFKHQFSGSSLGSELENYINRQQPTSVAEIERITKEYFFQKGYLNEIGI